MKVRVQPFRPGMLPAVLLCEAELSGAGLTAYMVWGILPHHLRPYYAPQGSFLPTKVMCFRCNSVVAFYLPAAKISPYAEHCPEQLKFWSKTAWVGTLALCLGSMTMAKVLNFPMPWFPHLGRITVCLIRLS